MSTLIGLKDVSIEEALKQARERGDQQGLIDPMMIPEVTKCYAPGGLLPSTTTPIEQPRESLIRRLLESTSGLTIVSAILAIVFGVLGLYTDKTNAQGWLDITKIFAGAVVGSAGASAKYLCKSNLIF